MDNKERELLINQFKIISNTSDCKHDKARYKLRVELLENRMDKLYNDIFNNIDDNISQEMLDSSNFLYDLLVMYEHIRQFLINNNIEKKSLKNQVLTIKVDNNELGLLPYTDITFYHNEQRYLNIKFDDNGINDCYIKHRYNLDLYYELGGHKGLDRENIFQFEIS